MIYRYTHQTIKKSSLALLEGVWLPISIQLVILTLFPF